MLLQVIGYYFSWTESWKMCWNKNKLEGFMQRKKLCNVRSPNLGLQRELHERVVVQRSPLEQEPREFGHTSYTHIICKFSIQNMDTFHYIAFMFEAVSVAMHSDDNVSRTWVNKDKEWMKQSSCGDFTFRKTSPPETQVIIILICPVWKWTLFINFFNAYSALCLARDIGQYQILSKWLYRPWLYSNQAYTKRAIYSLGHCLLFFPFWPLKCEI